MKSVSPLKLAIVASGRRQQRIARLCYMNVTKLSHIVSGRRQANPRERRNLAKVLGKPETELFADTAGVCPQEQDQ